jgi:hypothetical protein
MAKLMENKQMIHIASEIVVVIGLTFYFNQKNKKLMSHIEDLSQRIEEQEDLLQKHEQIIKKLAESIKQYQSEFNHKQRHSDYYEQPPPPQQIQMKQKKEIKPKSIVTKPVLSKTEPEPKLIVTNPVVSKPDTKVTFKEEEQPRKLRSPPKYEEEHEEEDEEEEEEDSDLDAELEEELKELVISDPVETGLKKRSR